MSGSSTSGLEAESRYAALLAVPAHPCARCARVQQTCCERAEVLVTVGDVARIAASTGRRDFVEHRVPDDAAYSGPDPDDPSWLRYTLRPAGSRRMLAREPGGACTFLGSMGCTLATEVRPLVCRLYPHQYTEAGLIGVDGEYCPTELFASEGRHMAEVLGMDGVDAARWHAMLYDELRSEARDGTP